jgi:hypothetical protein
MKQSNCIQMPNGAAKNFEQTYCNKGFNLSSVSGISFFFFKRTVNSALKHMKVALYSHESLHQCSFDEAMHRGSRDHIDNKFHLKGLT